MKAVVENATIIANDEMRVLNEGHVVLENGRISKFGVGTYTNASDVQIDASGMIVTPGFVSGHSHVWDAGIKDVGVGEPFDDFVSGHVHCSDLSKGTSNDEFDVVIRDALLEMLAAGIIAQCDFGCGGSHRVFRAKKGIPIKVVALESLCLWAGLGTKDGKFTESELVKNKKKLSEASLKEVNKMLDTADGIAINTANDFTDPALTQLSQLCRARKKMMTAHAAETTWHVETSLRRTGLGDVGRFIKYCRPDFLVHMVHANDKDLDLMAEQGIPIVSCPRANTLTAVGIPPIRRIMERGIIIGLGTDNACLNSQDLFFEMEFLSRMVRGIEQRKIPDFPSSRDILKMATLNGAKILHLDTELGSIREGKSANLVFIDGTDRNLRPVVAPLNSIVHRAKSSNVKAVMAGNKLVVKEAWDRKIRGDKDKIVQCFEDL